LSSMTHSCMYTPALQLWSTPVYSKVSPGRLFATLQSKSNIAQCCGKPQIFLHLVYMMGDWYIMVSE
jgi:hypothetical protein